MARARIKRTPEEQEKALKQFRKDKAYNACRFLEKFEWNALRAAGVMKKDTPEEITAKFVIMRLSPDEDMRTVAKFWLREKA